MAMTLTEALEDARVIRLTNRQKRLRKSLDAAEKLRVVGTRVVVKNGESELDFLVRNPNEENALTGVVYDFLDDLKTELQLQIQRLDRQIKNLIIELTTD